MKLHQAASTDKTAMQNRSAATVQRLNKPADMMDTRVTASAQVQRQTLSDQSPQAMQLKKHLASLNQAVQRAEDDELVQGKFATAQDFASQINQCETAKSIHQNTCKPHETRIAFDQKWCRNCSTTSGNQQEYNLGSAI